MTGRPAGARRWVGFGVLLLVVGAAGWSHWSGIRIAGTPVAVWPAPPPVGSCVNTVGGFAVVPCRGPHDAEIIAAHDALDPIVTDTARDPMYDACAVAADDYLGPAAGGSAIHATDGWHTLGLAYDVQPVAAPRSQRAGAYGWQICVIHPAVPVRYSGTVRHAPASAAPDAYRTCWDIGGDPVSCALPHTAEVLATGVPSLDATLSQQTRKGEPAAERVTALAERLMMTRRHFARQCAMAAGRVIGVPDPSFGHQLTVTALPAPVGAAGSPSGNVVGAQDCVIQADGGRQLVGSMVGWGDRPPPFTGR
jgi:hypothetical protein